MTRDEHLDTITTASGRTLTFDQRMPRWAHIGLCNFIQQQLRPEHCRGDHAVTRAFLEREHPFPDGWLDVEAALAWLVEHGAGCDCQVVLNTTPTPMPTRVH